MTIWAKFQQLVDRVLGEDERSLELREEELRLAAAALLINAASVDGKFEPEERKKLKALLEARFGLHGDGLKQILGEAEAWEQESDRRNAMGGGFRRRRAARVRIESRLAQRRAARRLRPRPHHPAQGGREQIVSVIPAQARIQ